MPADSRQRGDEEDVSPLSISSVVVSDPRLQLQTSLASTHTLHFPRRGHEHCDCTEESSRKTRAPPQAGCRYTPGLTLCRDGEYLVDFLLASALVKQFRRDHFVRGKDDPVLCEDSQS